MTGNYKFIDVITKPMNDACTGGSDRMPPVQDAAVEIELDLSDSLKYEYESETAQLRIISPQALSPGKLQIETLDGTVTVELTGFHEEMLAWWMEAFQDIRSVNNGFSNTDSEI